jgi:hypothetical protein
VFGQKKAGIVAGQEEEREKISVAMQYSIAFLLKNYD